LQKIKLRKIEEQFSSHPKIENLICFLDRFFKIYDAEFIILFGSSAKGTYNYRSDLDLLIITNSLKGNFFERLSAMQEITPGAIDFFIYNLDEFEKMVEDFNLVALEALGTGILIYDMGRGQTFIAHIKNLIKNHTIKKLRCGWEITR
jgi:predicted nucleotidyltransferase